MAVPIPGTEASSVRFARAAPGRYRRRARVRAAALERPACSFLLAGQRVFPACRSRRSSPRSGTLHARDRRTAERGVVASCDTDFRRRVSRKDDHRGVNQIGLGPCRARSARRRAPRAALDHDDPASPARSTASSKVAKPPLASNMTLADGSSERGRCDHRQANPSAIARDHELSPQPANCTSN